MKCAFHPDRDAEGMCVNCGRPVCAECRTILGDKIYCQLCANEIFVKGRGEAEAGAIPSGRSGKLTAGGILNIVAGAFGIIFGIVVAAAGAEVGAAWGIGALGTAGGILMIIFGIVAIVGGCYALQRKSFAMALAGAICVLLFCNWWFGIAALVLILLARKEFV
jgi:DNA-directed RNA polymerase subunit RPC12/RpoP